MLTRGVVFGVDELSLIDLLINTLCVFDPPLKVLSITKIFNLIIKVAYGFTGRQYGTESFFACKIHSNECVRKKLNCAVKKS